MWKILVFALAIVSLSAHASLDTHSLMEKQSDAVKFDERSGLGSQQPIYQVEVCPTNKCDLFESTSSSLLDDYVYLYSIYVGKYVDFAVKSPDGTLQPMAFIKEANDKGYATQVLNSYTGQFGCGKSD